MKKRAATLILTAILGFSMCATGCKKDEGDPAIPDEGQEEMQQEEVQQEEAQQEETQQKESEEDGSEDGYSEYGPDDDDDNGPATSEALGMLYWTLEDMKEEAKADPVRLKEVTPEKKAVKLEADEEVVNRSLNETEDIYLAWVDEVSVSF